MDVQCERCKTEYEFDDALVSGRGTTVRCTNCGHQFKVRRADGSPEAASQDRWVVTTTLGKQLVFFSLRELQRAIIAKQVSRSDALAHGAGPPRLLGSIAELEPFFEGRSSVRPPSENAGTQPIPTAAVNAAAQKRTPAYGLEAVPHAPHAPNAGPTQTQKWGSGAPPAYPNVRTPIPPPASAPTTTTIGLAPPRRESSRVGPLPEPVPPPRKKTNTLRPPAAVPPPATEPAAPVFNSAPPPAGRARTDDYTNDALAVTQPAVQAHEPLPEPATIPRGGTTSPYLLPDGGPQAGRPPEGTPVVSSPLPPPTNPIRRPVASSIDEEQMMMDAAARGRLAASTETYDDEDHHPQRRPRRVGGWIVAVVLLAGVGAVGWFVARPYLQNSAKTAASAQPLDPRAAQFLEAGEKALADGNLETAKENFDKASALAEKDPRVLLDVARLAAVRADQPWLELRLMAEAPPDQQKHARASLDELSAKAKRAADEALAAAPDETSAVRAKIDALRIAGDRDGARGYVQKVIASATQPETAYVLAALDLAEPEPVWSTVIERLRLAASAEGNAGRARAALVYALARSGQRAEARAELDKLEKLTRPYALTPLLRTFVDRSQPAKAHADAGVLDAGKVATIDAAIDPSRLPAALEGDGIPGDNRLALNMAHKAQASGNTGRARQLFEAVLARNPNDSEALCGMGDVARASGDSNGAVTYYKRVLAVNPSYLPALIGLADVHWSSGNQGEARRLYQEIVDRFPESAYPAHVKQRAGAAPPAPPASAAPTTTTTSTATATATATATEPAPAPTQTSTPTPSSDKSTP